MEFECYNQENGLKQDVMVPYGKTEEGVPCGTGGEKKRMAPERSTLSPWNFPLLAGDSEADSTP